MTRVPHNLDQIVDTIQSYPSSRDAVENTSIRVVGHGQSRVTIPYQNSEKIVKVAVNAQGVRENNNEGDIYNSGRQNGFSKHLVPVLDSSQNGSWIAMPFVDIEQDDHEQKVAGPKAEKIIKILESYGINLYEIETCVHNGKAKAYDYGCLESSARGGI